MYSDTRVKIPIEKGRILRKKISGTTYIYYLLDRVYDPEKKYSLPKSTTIGKCCDDDESMMFPNEKFVRYFPEEAAAMTDMKSDTSRSSCLRVGAYLVLRSIIVEYDLEATLCDIIGENAGLLLDLAVYTMITETDCSPGQAPGSSQGKARHIH